MRHSLKVLLASAAAGGLAAGMALASAPAGALPAKAAKDHAPTRAQVERLIKRMTAPNKPAPAPQGFTPEVAAGTAAMDSYNWSGYADVSSTAQYFTKVSGGWTVPEVTCTPEDRIDANWVGIDGANDETVEQTGTLSWCYEGSAHYYSWYEMYPAGSVTVGTTVNPGDKITASVTRKNTKYTLKLTDATTAGNNVTETASCALTACLDESAEWITERPAFSIGITPLAQFSSVKFTSASATGGGTTASITGFATAWDMTMVDGTDTYPLDSTSKLNAKGNAFTNAWLNSY